MRSMISNVPRHFQQQCQFILGFFWTISSLPTRLLYDFSYFVFHSCHSSSKLRSSAGAAEATPKHKIVRNIAGVMSLRPGVGKQMNMWAHQHFLKVFLLLPKKIIYLWSIIFFDPFFQIIFERLLKVLRVMYEINQPLVVIRTNAKWRVQNSSNKNFRCTISHYLRKIFIFFWGHWGPEAKKAVMYLVYHWHKIYTEQNLYYVVLDPIFKVNPRTGTT